MGDALAQAFRELKADRFRTGLSLLGVAVGIFSIVAALTLVDAMQQSIQEGFAVFAAPVLVVPAEKAVFVLNDRLWIRLGRVHGKRVDKRPRAPHFLCHVSFSFSFHRPLR